MLTLIAEQATPLESFTNALWRVTSDAPNISKVKGTFIGSNGDLVGKSIELDMQPSIAGTAMFEFELMEFYRDNLYYDIQTPNVATNALTANFSYFNLTGYVFQELLNVNGQLVIGDTIPLTSVTKTVVNAARQTYNPAGLVGYVIDPSTVGFEKFLTNSPRTIDISTGESYVLSVFSASNTINAISVIFRDVNGTSVGNTRIDYSTSISGRYDIAVGLANLTAAGVTIPSNAFTYDISIGVFSGSYSRQSETFTFRINNSCDSKRIHFLNRWGGFDSYTFTGYSTRTVDTKSTQYEKLLANGFTPKDRGRQMQYREPLVVLDLESRNLSEAELLWLEELATSPVAYLQEGAQLIPVTVNDDKVVTETEDLINLSISVTYANSIRNQRL